MFSKKHKERFLALLCTTLDKTGLYQTRCLHCMKPFFPHTIFSASAVMSAELCEDCVQILAPFQGSRCRICGLPTAMDSNGRSVCVDCAKKRPLWNSCAYHGLYSGGLRDLILRLKFDGELHLAKLFAEFLMEASICLPKPDIIGVIPQYPEHLRHRGYNQAWEIARAFAKQGKFNTDFSLVIKIRASRPQEGLSADERRVNLRNSFKASPKVKDKTVWLIDDVMTTGSTYAEASRALLKEGAKAIHALFVARTAV